MLFQENRKKGRFIKKNDKILKTIQVREYSFGKISEEKLTQPDNEYMSIIHHKLHDDRSLKKKIQQHGRIDKEFTSFEKPRSVIFPRDFTQDWMKQQSKSRGENRSQFEEEFEDGIDEEYSVKEREASPLKQETDSVSENPVNQKETPIMQQGEVVAETNKTLATDKPSKSIEPSIQKSMEIVTKSINQLKHLEQESSKDISQLSMHKEGEQEKAHPDSKLLEQKGYEKGYEKGFLFGEEKGFIQIHTQYQELIQGFKGVEKDIQTQYNELASSVQKESIRVLEEVTTAILREELSKDSKKLARLMTDAWKSLKKNNSCIIKVSRKDYEALKKLDEQDVLKKLVPEESLQNGDFMIEYPDGAIDGRLKTIVKDLMQKVGSSSKIL